MQRREIEMVGSGDFCARSSRSLRATALLEDPELAFEEELMLALETTPEVADTEAVSEVLTV